MESCQGSVSRSKRKLSGPKPPVEDQVIEQIRRRFRALSSGPVRLGIGDDAAILTPPTPGEEWLATTDQVIENTHFIRRLHPPGALGHKALARALSDLAAMGSTPLFFLLSLALPKWAPGVWLNQFNKGMFRLSRQKNIALIGGDVARGDLFSADVCAFGSAPIGSALRRDGARPGDIIYVSGRLGGATLGLSRLGKSKGLREAAIRRFLYPQPRISLGLFLREQSLATAAMDLSDGLSRDLSRLTRASQVGAEIEAAAVPVFRGASLEQALHGGEDYELLFCASPEADVPRRFEDYELTPIGLIRSRRGIVMRSDQGKRILTPHSFEHFSGAK